MRFLVVIFIFVLITIIGFQLGISLSKERSLQEEVEILTAKVEELIQEKQDLEAELNYLSHPENLEKELRARFNYKKPGEELLIIVPPSNE